MGTSNSWLRIPEGGPGSVFSYIKTAIREVSEALDQLTGSKGGVPQVVFSINAGKGISVDNPGGDAVVSNTGVTSVQGHAGDVKLVPSDLPDLAPVASPALTGIPTAPTAASGTNTTQIATTAFVQSAVTASSGGVPSILAKDASGNYSLIWDEAGNFVTQ